jgi:hypothetical protein
MEEVDELFNAETSNPNDVVKEIFSIKEPKARTELSASEISIISRLYYLSKLIKSDALKSILDEFIILRISKDRKSRGEFVQSFQMADSMNKQAGIMSNIANAFTKNR